MKLCVIGAGAAGLCAVRHGIDFGCDVTVFEKSDEIGGTWVHTDKVGLDKHGLETHSSMYQGLMTNAPKEIMGYPDKPYAEQKVSFVTAVEVNKYFQSYADEFNLRKFIKFEHHVLRVRPLQNETWEVLVQDLNSKKFETSIFDAVLVCNGHYFTPSIPKIEGQNLFAGQQIHSHDYRYAEKFQGESVLVIGAGPSGMDCTILIAKAAKHVTWSHHLENLPATKFGDNIDQRPDVKEITKSGVTFVDGSSRDYTVIVYCTGYRYTFPFLSADCGIIASNNYVRPLFKHCLSINHPSMGIIGLANLICPNQVFDVQVRFCLTLMTDRKKLPSKEEMLADMRKEKSKRKEAGLVNKKAHFMGPVLQAAYLDDLAAIAEIEPIKPVISNIFEKVIRDIYHDPTNFRNGLFKIIDDESFEVV